MDSSSIIDATIGLVLVYLFFSLITTVIQEYLASFFNRRGKLLEEALVSLLDGGRRGTFICRVTNFFIPNYRIKHNYHSLASDIFNHGSIWGLMRDDRLPSYIPCDLFASTLIDVLRSRAGEKILDMEGIYESIKLNVHSGTTRQALESMALKANGDIDKFNKDIETWYTQAMERVSGWYAREVRMFLFILGFLIAVSFNVDTIFLTKKLISDSDLRSRIVVSAQAVRNSKLEEELPALIKDVGVLELPIGWTDKWKADQLNPVIYDNNNHTQIDDKTKKASRKEEESNYNNRLCLMIFGWIITAFALSFGASFWFDLLQNLISIRATGKKLGDDSQKSKTEAIPATLSSKVSNDSNPNQNIVNAESYGKQNDFEKHFLSKYDICDIQRALKIPELQVSGEINDLTRERIRALQRRIGNTPNGFLTPELTNIILDNDD